MKKLFIALALVVALTIALALGISVRSSSVKVARKSTSNPAHPPGDISSYPDVANALNALPASEARVQWVETRFGQPVPAGAIALGQESSGLNNGVTQYVCRALYGSGMHPGKLIGGQCNIGYEGREVERPKYEVAVYAGGSWGRPVTAGALVGGWENNRYMNVCRVHYTEEIRVFTMLYRARDYGMHGGKLLEDGRCHFGYGGDEYASADYEVFYP
ncbi:MAG TPA: DM9 repeat-containing protein [Pyrinomonadaceae bacterium]|jgi:hypothetical protein|nr:DM9 repeat-containing protein [Pyrinomonadaceae bacterium]